MKSARKCIVNFEEHDYKFAKTEKKWFLSIQKSDVRIEEKKELALLEISHPLLLPMTLHWKEEALITVFSLPDETISFEKLKTCSDEDKLRAMINIAFLKQLLDLPLTFLIHPENCLFDYNLLPLLAYRGLEKKMPPVLVTTESFLRQYKCLIITLFEKDQDFMKLYEGQLDIKTGSPFIQTIILLESIEEIREYLMKTYLQSTAFSEEMTCKVSKIRFRRLKQLSFWMSLLSVILLVPLIYVCFFQIPFLNQMQNTDTAFLKGDYEEVITGLKNIRIEKMPFTQKYELAYSFVQGEALQEMQKSVILNHITLRSDADYLNYWIENGRGNCDEALDIAKKLEDSDLILFSLIQKIEQVRNNGNLSGTEKEETISKLEEEYNNYREKRQELLENETADSSTEVDK